ncbi:MAG: tRNA pseudouridine(55) synthase TruB [Rhizobiaceae bacterium]|nr:MAG: tRNA pseudouridine(55) synthase TruB [Rhizobiaceae bacterium]CAG0976614.1 tRNA pseudouridine synthase B [Rhizobiaceae bacterium]
MARRGKKKGRPVSGWLVFDKPVGMGSTEAVSKVKWLFQAEKAGHAGTLDPLASGMLPIALGEATKTVPYVMDGAKVYRFAVAWGEERATDDREGPATKISEKRPTEAEIRAVMPNYTGIIQQTPPQFSAIKIAGERAYDLAREGETVEIPSREVEIGRLDLVEMRGADLSVFEVECGKGTYVRSIARDMGRDLGCYGHIAELRRTEVEPFTPEDLVTLAELETAADLPKAGETEEGKAAPRSFAALDALLVETAAALEYMPQVAVTDDAAVKIRLGNPVIVRGRDAPVEAAEACATARGKLIAVGAIEAGMFKPRRVFTEG